MPKKLARGMGMGESGDEKLQVPTARPSWPVEAVS